MKGVSYFVHEFHTLELHMNQDWGGYLLVRGVEDENLSLKVRDSHFTLVVCIDRDGKMCTVVI